MGELKKLTFLLKCDAKMWDDKLPNLSSKNHAIHRPAHKKTGHGHYNVELF